MEKLVAAKHKLKKVTNQTACKSCSGQTTASAQTRSRHFLEHVVGRDCELQLSPAKTHSNVEAPNANRLALSAMMSCEMTWQDHSFKDVMVFIH